MTSINLTNRLRDIDFGRQEATPEVVESLMEDVFNSSSLEYIVDLGIIVPQKEVVEACVAEIVCRGTELHSGDRLYYLIDNLKTLHEAIPEVFTNEWFARVVKELESGVTL